MRTHTTLFPDGYVLNQPVRGICENDVLNPCWDNRPTDIPGKHWGSDAHNEVKACKACTDAAFAALIAKAAKHDELDEACLLIQDAIGQTDGGVAGVYFSGVNDWKGLPILERTLHLEAYLATERLYTVEEANRP